jgi:hypothetical protein
LKQLSALSFQLSARLRKSRLLKKQQNLIADFELGRAELQAAVVQALMSKAGAALERLHFRG